MGEGTFTTGISRHIWDTKYRYRDGATINDETVADTWRRIAHALAEPETHDQTQWQMAFYNALQDFHFLPGGRIQAGAGTDKRVTLFNCFVMGAVHDSMEAIFDALKEGAITMQQGGGVGYDFSTLRPRGVVAHSVGSVASGPVSFMRIWDSMCATVLSTGARRGAMMATLRCDHPDVEEFIDAKREASELRHFNLSVLISDDFMQALHADAMWPLVFPAAQLDEAGVVEAGDVVIRYWPGNEGPVPCRVLRRVRARDLWAKIMRATYDYAEPGVLFIDQINRLNNLWYRERISATNPCGEIPLPPYGACNLGSINLTKYVTDPFSKTAQVNVEALRDVARTATRMLDNVIDTSRFPLKAQHHQATGTRRIGLGMTGLADALIMLGVKYDCDRARELAATVMREICHAAYRASVELARSKGPFPFLDREAYLEGKFIKSLPGDIRDGIAQYGIRNSHLTAIAPTGTISLLANNVSSGLEPVFAYRFRRQVLELDGSYTEHQLTDYAYHLWRKIHGDAPLPAAFIDAHGVSPETHLGMQAALQPYVDSAISKTINVPEHYEFEAFKNLYLKAYNSGLKGCTTFRTNPVTGAILEAGGQYADAHHCCSLEREAD
jgi:ribonucleoside-diphosphate reductase alpha chain